MHASVDENRAARLFLVLGGFFLTNALMAEFIGVKIFSLERTLGGEPLRLRLWSEEPLSFQLTAGVVLWPFVFVMTDIVNEYFGRRGVRLLSILAAILIAYAFAMVALAIQVVPADFWIGSQSKAGVPDMQAAFRAVFGQGQNIIVGSLLAFLIGQLVDVLVFQRIKRWTGERWIWLRATGSTVVSQLLDSFVVLFVAFYLYQGWSLRLVLSIGVVNYAYKFLMAVALTPVLYLVHRLVERYLGASLAAEMRRAASQG
jgi:hypothetical protein